MTLDLASPERAFVIAEAGTAHAAPSRADRFAKAMRMVEAAAKAKADAVKFQWFTDDVGPRSMFCWIEGDERRACRWQASALQVEQWAQVKEFAEACGLVFLASTFEMDTVSWLRHLDVTATKVASRAAKDFPYDAAPAPYLISNGMYELGDGSQLRHPASQHTHILQCEARYPSTTAWQGQHEGFSDHSGAPFLAIDAIQRGCKLIELHYRLDAIDAGPDLPATLSLDELATVCRARDYWAKRVER